MQPVSDFSSWVSMERVIAAGKYTNKQLQLHYSV